MEGNATTTANETVVEAERVSDWFSLCNMTGLRAAGLTAVAFFVDVSGSLDLAHVQTAHDQFKATLAREGLELLDAVYNGDENWILPHITDYAE